MEIDCFTQMKVLIKIIPKISAGKICRFFYQAPDIFLRDKIVHEDDCPSVLFKGMN